MKNLSLFIFIIGFILMSITACHTENIFTVEGTIDPSMNGKKIYLSDYNADNKIIDSCEVVEGKFSFTGNADSLQVLRVFAERYYANFLPEKGIIKIFVGNPSVISGTKLNEALEEYQKEGEEINKIMRESASKGPSADEHKANYEEYKKNKNALEDKYLEPNKANKLGLLIIWDKIQNFETSLETTDSLINITGNKALEFGPIKKIRTSKENALKTKVGNMFNDFACTNPDGTPAKLSDYVGKGNYVLTDFWASWCGPCLQEMPAMKEVYNAYKDKGLVVLGINVWDSKEGFSSTVAKLEIPWAQICCFDNENATTSYGINGIPQIILFAPDGKIVARGLRGDNIKAKIAELY